jgi:hypothetical protein
MDNNKRDLRGDVDWIGLAQNMDNLRALMNAIMNFRAPENAGKL